MHNSKNNLFRPFVQMLSLFVLTSALFSFLAVNPVMASGTNPACPSVYGVQCPTGQIAVDKKIQNPKSGEWVEALSSNEINFIADQEVNFRVEVKNIGSTNLSPVNVQDKLPNYVNYVSGATSYDANTKTLYWTIDNLNSGDFRLFYIKAKVKPLNELPQVNITCLTNYAKAEGGNSWAEDTAMFCVQTPAAKTIPVEQLPKTGLPLIAWSLVGLLPAGFGLKRFSSLNKDNQDKPIFISQKREFEKES